MKFFKRDGQLMPKHIVEMAEKVKGDSDGVNRREFLALASVFGATAATAYAMIGLPTPALADGHAKKGGTVRYQTEVRPLKDPRTYDWSQIANLAPLAGWSIWFSTTHDAYVPGQCCWIAGMPSADATEPIRSERP